MRRRNAIMAALSIIFIVLLLIAMALAVSSGLGSLGFLVLGGFSFAVLLGVVILAFPILIFVMITIILLVIETSRATRVAKARWWSRQAREVETTPTVYTEEPPQGRYR